MDTFSSKSSPPDARNRLAIPTTRGTTDPSEGLPAKRRALDSPQHYHTLHYPLNGVDLDFGRYSYRPLGQRDILINRIMEDYMRPHRARRKAYLEETPRGSAIAQVKSLDREFGVCLQLANKMLETKWNVEEEIFCSLIFSDMSLSFMPWYHCRNRLPSEYEFFPSLDEFVYGLLQRHFLETDLSLQVLIKFLKKFPESPPWRARKRRNWKQEIAEHLKTLKPNMEVQHRFGLFPGRNHQYSVHGHVDPLFFVEPYIIAIKPSDLTDHLEDIFFKYMKLARVGRHHQMQVELHNLDIVSRKHTRRSSSQPAPEAWCSALWGERYILFPRRPLSEVDKLSRRRSLSRTHIRSMFCDPPSVVPRTDPDNMWKKPAPSFHCSNCTGGNHLLKNCPFGCGYCDSNQHKADACPVNPINRCKCCPYPQYHVVSNCTCGVAAGAVPPTLRDTSNTRTPCSATGAAACADRGVIPVGNAS